MIWKFWWRSGCSNVRYSTYISYYPRWILLRWCRTSSKSCDVSNLLRPQPSTTVWGLGMVRRSWACCNASWAARRRGPRPGKTWSLLYVVVSGNRRGRWQDGKRLTDRGAWWIDLNVDPRVRRCTQRAPQKNRMWRPHAKNTDDLWFSFECDDKGWWRILVFGAYIIRGVESIGEWIRSTWYRDMVRTQIGLCHVEAACWSRIGFEVMINSDARRKNI